MRELLEKGEKLKYKERFGEDEQDRMQRKKLE